MHLKDLKQKSPKELLTQAEELGIEDASSMRCLLYTSDAADEL